MSRLYKGYADCIICGNKNIINIFACSKCWESLNHSVKEYVRDYCCNIPNHIPREQEFKYVKSQYDKYKQ